MVSSVLFYQVHQRLNEILGCATELLFAWLPILVCGDLYQLPPVKGTPIYCNTGPLEQRGDGGEGRAGVSPPHHHHHHPQSSLLMCPFC